MIGGPSLRLASSLTMLYFWWQIKKREGTVLTFDTCNNKWARWFSSRKSICKKLIYMVIYCLLLWQMMFYFWRAYENCCMTHTHQYNNPNFLRYQEKSVPVFPNWKWCTMCKITVKFFLSDKIIRELTTVEIPKIFTHQSTIISAAELYGINRVKYK